MPEEKHNPLSTKPNPDKKLWLTETEFRERFDIPHALHCGDSTPHDAHAHGEVMHYTCTGQLIVRVPPGRGKHRAPHSSELAAASA